MSEPARRIRRKPRPYLDAIHDRREWFEEQGLKMERGEELHHDPNSGAVTVIYTVSERLSARDS